MAGICVIDDDEDLAVVMSVFLMSGGHAVHIEDSGQQGLDWLASNPCDLLLVDGFLQDVSGEEICRRLRASGNTMPIIVISGEARPEFEEKMLAAGASSFLTKPFNLDALDKLINSLLLHNMPPYSKM